MAQSQTTPSAYDILEVLFRHKKKVVLIPAVILAIGLGIALFAPRTYQSEAKLALQIGRESVNIDPTAQTGQQMISLQQVGREGEVVTAIDLLKSRGVIAQVVDRLGADYVLRGGPEGSGESNFISESLDATVGAAANYAIGAIKSIDPISDREEAIIKIEENLVADAERDSTLIVVTYGTKSPVGAQTVLDTLIEIYQQEHMRIHRNDESRNFFQEQEKQFRNQLDAAMAAVRDAKDEIGVASIEARRQNLEDQLQATTMASYEAETSQTATLAEVEDLRRQLSDLPERMVSSKTSSPNEGADLMREQLYALQVRRADLKARYSPTHPLVEAISRQVEEAEKVVDGQMSVREATVDDVNPIHRERLLSLKQKQSVLASLEGRLLALREQEKAIRQDLEKLNSDAVRIARLEREETLASRKFYRYSDSLEQARIDEELENQNISSISLAQEPTLTEKPASPSKVLVGLASIVLAFAATAATILGLEQVNDKLRNESAIERASGVPVLTSIPESSIHGRVLASL